MINILFFIDGFRKGGKERRLIELLKSIEKEKFDYRVVVIHQEIEYEITKEIKNRIIQIKKNKKKDLSPFFAFYRICRDFNPDIIHTWSSMVTFYSIPSKILLNKKLVNSQITDAPPKFNKWSIFGLTCRINFFFSDIVLANSYSGLTAYQTSSRKSKVIYNGVDLKRFDIEETKEDIKHELGITTRYSIAMVASFSDNKDYKTYIQVAYELQKIKEGITFLTIGNGKNLEDCKNYAAKLGIKIIHFLGKRNDIEKILKACDIGVLISNEKLHGEGISNSIIEYMAMRLPVVANNAGGTKEIVRNHYNGFLICDNMVKSFNNRIIELIDNGQLRKEFGKNSREAIEKEFSLSRMTKQFIECWNKMIEKNKY